ncbi:hypothetical protein [Haladaptatus halobius]|uniref:hypothetical protein n=1 Tax=Haladaptatus halobius TaxID=2884875 RepID=UPI001D0A6B23|nr:hypothetical protein [Haladaptatus halobius]
MESPDNLNETDIAILELLVKGRETRGSLASRLEKHENYIGERLRWLRAYDLVQYRHEETALYEITDKGQEWMEKQI